MNNKGQMDRGEQMIQSALGDYLQARRSLGGIDADSRHLDEDVLTVFVEGNLSGSEAKPVISHLADCSYCLHVSAELIKLDMVFAEEAKPIVVAEAEPAGVGEVLGGILSRIFGSNDGAVFALEEKAEDDENGEENENKSE